MVVARRADATDALQRTRAVERQPAAAALRAPVARVPAAIDGGLLPVLDPVVAGVDALRAHVVDAIQIPFAVRRDEASLALGARVAIRAPAVNVGLAAVALVVIARLLASRAVPFVAVIRFAVVSAVAALALGALVTELSAAIYVRLVAVPLVVVARVAALLARAVDTAQGVPTVRVGSAALALRAWAAVGPAAIPVRLFAVAFVIVATLARGTRRGPPRRLVDADVVVVVAQARETIAVASARFAVLARRTCVAAAVDVRLVAVARAVLTGGADGDRGPRRRVSRGLGRRLARWRARRIARGRARGRRDRFLGRLLRRLTRRLLRGYAGRFLGRLGRGLWRRRRLRRLLCRAL
mmetsp:Transcript_13562/g.41874  ORF Transcript_13562/g.41874 Transcript_13562/m.41874 type:complete len:354 (-) Transcript_13562:1457-2518(-)